MPYKSEKIKLPRKLDRRVKLTDEDRRMIKQQYGILSQRELAKQYGVSRRLITFIGDPDKQKQNLIRREERGGSMAYYAKEKHREYMKNHRKYKYGLLKEGKISDG